MEIRRRTIQNHNEVTTTELASRPKKIKLRRRRFVILVFFGILLLAYLAIAYNLKPARIGSSAIDSLATSLNLHKPIYVVIIDAGSTGSRLLVFTFHTSILERNLVLDDESFIEIKPGLSSFADNPKEGIQTLANLVEQAKLIIPEVAWPYTPISVKATAGLRLLPKDKADAIIKEGRQFLSNSGFAVTIDSISIMEGADEGIFAWFTVNFLIGRLSMHGIENTVAVLDLGGGSTQITYALADQSPDQLDKHVYKINAFNHNMSIHTRSHLGMGLMAARKAILTSDIDPDLIESGGIVEIRSECVNPIISENWSYGGVNFLVKGPVNGSYRTVKTLNYAGADEHRPIVRFSECVRIIKKHTDTIKGQVTGLNQYEIYLISYYFDRATEVGLIDPFNGGLITLKDFHKVTVNTCNYPNADQPFMCLDLTFIYILLHDCFELPLSTNLNLYKKYNGHELSWALGYAFSLLQSDF